MQGTSTLQLVLHAGLFVKCILVILAVFSITSWSIILQKLLAFQAASRQSDRFRRAFESGAGLRELAETAGTLTAGPLANLFRIAHEAKPAGRREAIGAALKRGQAAELERLQTYLTFLATTGSTTPFIGLLGTVWGIMDAFRGIGAAGSASLAVVSPAIAEALITTAAGLLAAIPAAMAYNVFLDQVRNTASALEEFGEVLLERLADGARHA